MGQEEVYEVLNVLEFNRWDGLQSVVGSRIFVNVTWKNMTESSASIKKLNNKKLIGGTINKTFCYYSISQDIDF